MSLNATMWTSVSGLLAHGSKMNTVGNNIANISTVGFKGQRHDFADFVYQDTNSLAGPTQSGFGVQTGALMGNFNQGALESTTESTDLAISGKGWFQVQPIGSDEAFYTRAGNFRFNKDGYLNDPNGFALQGWRIDNTGGVMQASGGVPLDAVGAEETFSPIIGSGVPTDIRLDTMYVPPQQTTRMDFMANLPKNGVDAAKNTENPFAALFNVWDGTQPPKTPNTLPIAKTSYATQTTMAIYDEAGIKHNVTVYYDKVSSNEYEGGNSGDEIWEYIVTMDPAEDKRQFADPITGVLTNVNETKAGGILMSGTMTFNSGGALINQSAYTWGGSQTPEANPGSYTDVPDPAGGLADKQVINLDPNDMNNWQPAAISSNGFPMVVPNFGGILDAQTTGTANGARYNTEINFGLRASNLAMPWQSTGSLADLDVAAYAYNNANKPNDPTRGPEHVLLNTAYDATLDGLWNADTNRYELGGTPLWTYNAAATGMFNAIQALAPGAAPVLDHTLTYDPPKITSAPGVLPVTTITTVTQADYMKMLELYDIEGVILEAGSISAAILAAPGPPPVIGVAAVPSEKVLVNLTTGGLTKPDGTPLTPANPTALPPILADGGVVITTAAHLEKISASIKVAAAANAGKAKNLNLLSAAIPSNANDLAEFTEPPIIEPGATSNLGTEFSSSNGQDGYGFGSLVNWDVDQNGILQGRYSNGVSLPLWQLTMFDFTSPQGLRREGNNLFTQTRESGEARSGAAGTAGLGSITSHHLEQSNVDMSTEFVYMITTQRGFQSNSKLITTTDQMLETVINMKR